MTVVVCARCRSEAPARFHSCPACGAPLHDAHVAQLLVDAQAAEAAGDLERANTALRDAAALLPPQDPRREPLGARLEDLARRRADAPKAADSGAGWGAGLGVVGVVAFLLSKGKFLLGGLTKAGPLLSILASLGVYWAMWGWKFGLGLIVLVYIHELGHVAALRRLGVPATPPMFVPGLGAFVRHAPLATDREQADVALGGPEWGLGATVAVGLVALATGEPLFAALTLWSARINLFNLVPMPPLDGGGAIGVLSRGQRFGLAAVCAVALALSGEGLLWLVVLVAAFRVLGPGAARGDGRVFLRYAGLVVALSWLATIDVPLPGAPAR
ncbi:MAG: site-2 protease family protein [Vicinamibacteria bacterium]|nr:site-2 protease family protein [Vicinamibacteria bacterium]